MLQGDVGICCVVLLRGGGDWMGKTGRAGRAGRTRLFGGGGECGRLREGFGGIEAEAGSCLGGGGDCVGVLP